MKPDQNPQQPSVTSPQTFLDAQSDTDDPQSSGSILPAELNSIFGRSGTRIFAGFISGEEYNADLAGRQGIAVYDQMRRSDSSVSASLRIITEPLMAADWDIEAASDDPNDVLAAEFVRYNLFECLKWRDFQREAFLCLPFGFSLFEKNYDWCEWRGTADGTGAGRYICLDTLASRKQDTIIAWQLKDGSPGVRQVPPNGGEREIPAWKNLIFTHQREGNNYEGISVLRTAYKHWYIKTNLEKVMAIAAERQGTGVPYFTPPTSATEDEKKKARIALQNMRTNEQAYLEIPQGWEFGFMDMKAGTVLDPTPQIQYHGRQILLNTLGQFLDMGSSGSSGSRATSQDHSKLQEQSLEAVAAMFEDTINENLIKQLVDANFNVSAYPKLTHSRISDDNVAQLSDAVNKLGSAGFLTPDADLENTLRELLYLPDLPDDVAENYSDRQQSASQSATPTQPAGMPGMGNAPAPADQPDAPDSLDAQAKEDDIAVKGSDLIKQTQNYRMQLIKRVEQMYDADQSA